MVTLSSCAAKPALPNPAIRSLALAPSVELDPRRTQPDFFDLGAWNRLQGLGDAANAGAAVHPLDAQINFRHTYTPYPYYSRCETRCVQVAILFA